MGKVNAIHNLLTLYSFLPIFLGKMKMKRIIVAVKLGPPNCSFMSTNLQYYYYYTIFPSLSRLPKNLN